MSLQTRFPRWRAWITALCCMFALGCTTVPPESASKSREAKVDALKQLGFAPATKGWELTLLIYGSGADHVSDDGVAAIEDVARALSTLGIERIWIEGHTDNIGSAKNNVALSQRRAEAVAQHFVKTGWRDDAIERRGYGSERPISDNATPAGRAQNRRVVVAVQVE